MSDLKEMEWVFDGTLPLSSSRSQDWAGNFVLHLIPDCFDAYVKIFHAIYEDPSIKDSSETWDEIDNESLDVSDAMEGMPQALLELLKKSTLLYRSADSSSELKRVLWKELAEELGLVFHSELNSDSFTRSFPNRSWPRYLLGPSE